MVTEGWWDMAGEHRGHSCSEGLYLEEHKHTHTPTHTLQMLPFTATHDPYQYNSQSVVAQMKFTYEIFQFPVTGITGEMTAHF